MKKLLLIFLFANEISFSQTFTKITSGTPVNDAASSYGCSWADYDNDGDLDIFISNVYSENDILYSNNGNNSFTKITNGAIVTDSKFSESSSWADYDNDGDLDVFVALATGQNNALYRNDGNGVFTKITSGSIVTNGGDSRNGAWGDYDNDGFLDLFVSNSNNQSNFLYHNNGNGTFTKITTGAIVTNVGNFHGAHWADYDNDNDLDLYVSNQGGNDCFYENNGNGTFAKITSGPIVSNSGYSVGGSWGDFNNDGNLDLFVPRTTTFSSFTNTIYINNGNKTFSEISSNVIEIDGGASTGSGWADYDNDGDIDLFVANTTVQTSTQVNFLYENTGNANFTKITTGALVADVGVNSRGVAWADYDNDGDMDLYVANELSTNNFFFENNGNSNNWINIKCEGLNNNNRSAIGARVYVKTTNPVGGNQIWQIQEISAQTGYMGQNSLNVEFGLGASTIIDSIKVRWPSGLICYYTNVPSNQFLYTTDNCELSVMGIENKSNTGFDVTVFPNPNNGKFTVIANREERSGKQSHLTIYNILGEVVYRSVGNAPMTIDISAYSKGIYFLTIYNGGKIISKKLVVEE